MSGEPQPERVVAFYRAGQPLDRPAGWDIYAPDGTLIRREWNPERHESDLEKAVREFRDAG